MKKFSPWLIFIISACFFHEMLGQTYMTSDSFTVIPTLYRNLYYNDLDSCSPVDSSVTTRLIFTGIALPNLDDAYLYGGTSVTSDNYGLQRYDLGFFLYHLGDFPQNADIQALSCNYEGLVFAAGTGLSTYDQTSSTMAFLGDFPPGMRAGGDLTYREGRLYMTTRNNELVEVDIDNPANSTVLATFPDSIPLIQGLATFPFRCDSIVTYAIAGHPGQEKSTVYLLDFETYTLTEICQYNRFNYDAATSSECMLPPCELYADLDLDDSSGDSLNNYTVFTCASPVGVAGPDVGTFSPFPLDSMRLELLGSLDGALEYLSSSGAPSISVQGNNTASLLFINQGGATAGSFSQAIRNTLYYNDAAAPAPGARQVAVSLYSSFYNSLPSLSTIVLGQELLALETDTASVFCFGAEDGSVSLSANFGAPPYTFLWPDGAEAAQRSGLAAGLYPILLTDSAGCQNTDTLYISQPDSLWAAIGSAAAFVCGDNGTLSAAAQGGAPPYAFAWNGQPGGDTLYNAGPGLYQLQVTDANGCAAAASYTLAGADTLFTFGQATLCQGESFAWQGQAFSADTTLCTAYTSSLGCDSIHCLSLVFRDTSLHEERHTICWNESLSWEGLTLSADTSLCRTYTGANGCDSTLCLRLQVLERAGYLEAAICEGERYAFGGRLLASPGWYADTISLAGGCDSLRLLQLAVRPRPAVAIQASGSLCASPSITLSASPAGAYAWSTGAGSPEITVGQAGSYSLTVTNADGCSAADTISLSDTPIEAGFRLQPPRCPGQANGSITIDSARGGVEPYLYALNGGPLQATPQWNNLPAGAYTLLVEDTQGCRREFAFLLEDPPPLLLALPADTTLRLGDSLRLQALTNAAAPTLYWQPPDFLSCDTCLAPVARPLRTTTYQALLSDSLGCTVADAVTLFVGQRSGLYVPNAFSPNGDGRNDRLAVYGDASVETVLSFRLFNRWGALLFERSSFAPNDESLGWDGAARGQPAPAGAYVYSLRYRRADGREVQVEGEVLLVR